MGSIIIAFPSGKKKTAAKIKETLNRNGLREIYEVSGGAEALREMGRCRDGIVICPTHLGDMHYTELLSSLPQGFKLLLIDSASRVSAGRAEDVIALAMPVTVRAFLETIHMMSDAGIRKDRKKRDRHPPARDDRDENYIRNAKSVLIERNHMTEEEAHRYLQKTSMDAGRSLVETAQMILYMAVR